MAPVAEEHQLLQACTVLFGNSLQLHPEFLDYLQISGLKSAFRRRALAMHPDLGAAVDQPQARTNTEAFHQVREAFEQLHRYLELRDAHRSEKTSRTQRICDPNCFSSGETVCKDEQTQHAGANQPYDRLINPHLPCRRLLFGHFLYYSGLADWRTIVRVLIWQRMNRPRLGELGCRLGWLRHEDIPLILQNRNFQQPFGLTAVHLGMLSEYHLKVLLLRQQQMQKKFGTILVEKNFLTQSELQDLLVRFEHHNADVLQAHHR